MVFCSDLVYKLKAVTHGATSVIRLAIMKLISPCDRAKTCCKRLLKVPCDYFNDRALLYSYNVFILTFPNQPIIYSRLFQFNGGNQLLHLANTC